MNRLLILLLALCCHVSLSARQPLGGGQAEEPADTVCLSMADVSGVLSGDVVPLKLSLTAPDGAGVTAAQFRMELPQGLTLDAGAVTLETATGHTLRHKLQADGASYLFMLYSSEGELLPAGLIMTLPVSVAADAPQGEYKVRLTDVMLVNLDADDVATDSEAEATITVEGEPQPPVDLAIADFRVSPAVIDAHDPEHDWLYVEWMPYNAAENAVLGTMAHYTYQVYATNDEGLEALIHSGSHHFYLGTVEHPYEIRPDFRVDMAFVLPDNPSERRIDGMCRFRIEVQCEEETGEYIANNVVWSDDSVYIHRRITAVPLWKLVEGGSMLDFRLQRLGFNRGDEVVNVSVEPEYPRITVPETVQFYAESTDPDVLAKDVYTRYLYIAAPQRNGVYDGADSLTFTFWTDYDTVRVVVPVVDDMERTVRLNMTAARWATLCLPFEASVPEGLAAYSCTLGNDSTLVLHDELYLEPNTPYIMHGNRIATYDFDHERLAERPVLDTLYRSGPLTGTLQSMYAPEGCYVLQNGPRGAAFYLVDEPDAMLLGANRAYLEVPDDYGHVALRRTHMRMMTEGEFRATAIDAPQAEADAAPWYTPTGIRVDAPTHRGLYISRGRKVLK